SLAHSTLFQEMFIWEDEFHSSQLNLVGLRLRPLGPPAEGTVKVDLSLYLREESERIIGVLEYATSLFEHSTIERYLGYLYRIFEAMASNHNQVLNRLRILSDSELWQILYHWNDTRTDYSDDKCVQELFEEQVSKSPAAVAVE